MKIKKKISALGSDIVVGDEVENYGRIVFVGENRWDEIHFAFLDEDGDLASELVDPDYGVDIYREVEKPDIMRVGLSTGGTMVVQDFDDGKLSISIYDTLDRAVYGAPSVDANELINAIKAVKGLD